MKQNWLMTIHNSIRDVTMSFFFVGTEEEMKQLLIQKVNKEHSDFATLWDTGTIGIEEIQKRHTFGWQPCYYAFNAFVEHHTDYTVIPVNEISYI